MKLCRIWKVVATIRSAKQEPNTIPFNEQVQIRASYSIEMVSSVILRFSLAKRTFLISLQPIRIRAANAFAALAFLVWSAERRVLQKAVCHLATRIDNKI